MPRQQQIQTEVERVSQPDGRRQTPRSLKRDLTGPLDVASLEVSGRVGGLDARRTSCESGTVDRFAARVCGTVQSILGLCSDH